MGRAGAPIDWRDMHQLEIEVKFFIADPEALRQSLAQMGAVCREAGFEKNLILDTAEGRLRARGQLLRLRQDAGVSLTFKTPTAPDDQYKVYAETNIELRDAGAMQHVLAQLGYHPVRTYEKWRETYILDEACLCIDRMPFGVFLEIEASGGHIRTLADHLGLPWRQRILKSYLELFALLKQHLSLSFEDITFANFAEVAVDFSTCLPAAQAGSA